MAAYVVKFAIKKARSLQWGREIPILTRKLKAVLQAGWKEVSRVPSLTGHEYLRTFRRPLRSLKIWRWIVFINRKTRKSLRENSKGESTS